MKSRKIITALSLALGVTLFEPFVSLIQAESSLESAIVRSVKGAAYYSKPNGAWVPLKVKTDLQQGMLIKTAPESNVILQLAKSGGVLRVNPDTVVSLAKLAVTVTPLETIAETDVSLIQGSVTGSQKKTSASSKSKISLTDGFAMVDSSEYQIDADGSISVFRGSASLNFLANHEKIGAGEIFKPSEGVQKITHAVLSSTPLPEFASTAPVPIYQTEADRPVSPHGNNGVGNGIDPAPPGNPGDNDGPGTGPGNPGNGRPTRP
jgi:hypothetical protein